MKVRWLHKIWTAFWTATGVLLIVTALISGGLYGVLQLPSSKEYVARQIEKNVSEGREAYLTIEKLDGHLPFSMNLSGINFYADTLSETPVFHSDSLWASIDLTSILQRTITITSVTILEPMIDIDASDKDLLKKLARSSSVQVSSSTIDSTSKNFEILIPSLALEQGVVHIQNIDTTSSLIAKDQLTFTDLDLNVFLEYSPNQKYIDIENLSFGVPEAEIEEITIFGQLFNDATTFELNAFSIQSGDNFVRFNGGATDLDIFGGALSDQIRNTEFELNLRELHVGLQNLHRISKQVPPLPQHLDLKLQAKGSSSGVNVSDIQFKVGESGFIGSADFVLPVYDQSLTYNASFEKVSADSSDIENWFPNLSDSQKKALASLVGELSISGTEQSINLELVSDSKNGSLELTGKSDLNESPAMNFIANISHLNLGGLIHSAINETDLNGSLKFNTNSFDPTSAKGEFQVQLERGVINAFNFDSLEITTNWNDGEFSPEYAINSVTTSLGGSGMISLADSIPEIELTGFATNFDLKALTQLEQLTPSQMNLEYDFYGRGRSVSDAFSQLTIDIPRSIVGGDTLTNHQIYADYSTGEGLTKNLRLTSNVMDVTLNGVFNPADFIELVPFWSNYVKNRVNDEILFETGGSFSMIDSTSDQNMTINMELKDYPLLASYWTNLPDIESSFVFNSQLNMNADRLLFTGDFTDSHLKIEGTTADSVSVQVTGSFRAREKLKDFSGLQFQASIGTLNSELVEASGLSFQAELDEDSIYYQQNIERVSSDASFDLSLNAQLTDSLITMNLENFLLGQESYRWRNSGIPVLQFYDTKALAFNNFRFYNDEEQLTFDGVFSDQPDDSVNYNVQNVNLKRISDLLKGRIDLSGTLNGSFTTKSLTRIPTIQGDLAISAFAIDDRVVGDIELTSNYNSEYDRFDTRIEVATDSAKYPDYYTRNERVGQSIILDGYILAPDENGFPVVDSLYYFDLNFESIDLWILPFIAPRVFEDMSGIASGFGSVYGNLEDFDYTVDYDIGTGDAVFFKPRFLETFYYAQGGITLSKSKGLEFRDVYIIDPSGGYAVLSGSYNLGHLGKIHDIDIRVEMSEFQFLNSDFDPELTFFGDAYGSTIVRITGTNLNPVITTETPVLISDFSSIGIPLLAETEFDEDNKFIRFVDSFDEYQRQRSVYTDQSGIIQIEEEANPFDASFAERFTLDLQFVADNSMTVELIFDPVTGDMIQADGTGRIGIRLEDEEFSMFGQFDISGGTYNFVSGEIFTRRFQLEPGGTMIWEGSPANARLNINAIYEARPDINTLTTARSDLEGESSQRVPVQLVLNVGGSLTAIENEFYFRLPNTIETRQNTTVSTQINALNRNEDEKLIQAASFLLMGDFIPSTTASTDATNSIASNFSGSGAVLNPLLSSQLISPLLSNQINSLLRSDIGSLDIDFNLNTYNNVDLGVALRLYNDRIILSREGQITGAQSNIGDLGATYRINQTLSVTAFHRQDPTFSTLNGAEESQQAQDINGVGLEAEMSFNTWQEFFRKLTHPFRRLFGKKEDTEELASAE